MNATRTIAAAPITRSFRVSAPQQKAFDVFLAGMGRWWPRDHSLLKAPRKDVVIEPEVGGRWFETGEDGSLNMWGRVLEWDKPNRAVLAWQINGEWAYDPDFETKVEIRFTPDGDGTIVEFEHRNLEAFDRTARDGHVMAMDTGWGLILDSFKAEAEGA
ncbi:MAG: ATPase [Alphaproteobacteria bacterium]|nr:ATPase [Alphaproteobacteria bacterium]